LILFAILENFGLELTWIGVSIAQFLALVLLFAALETRHQCLIRRKEPFVKPKKIMDSQDFEERVNKGEKLMILDDLVLDVSEFINHHPGGKFFIVHCIGTDISKYFYGGYSLENNISPGKS
jgi:cytochrome b involved in lipid metabolism